MAVFQVNKTFGSEAIETNPNSWHLSIPKGKQGRYRLAQIDDYCGLERKNFTHTPPCTLTLQARIQPSSLPPGTWGFGFWNDPFSLSLGLRGGTRRFPALPNAAWFFFASQENYLSFRDDLPANGALAATFRSPRWPPVTLSLAAPLLPLLILRPAARHFRRMARELIHQDAVNFDSDATYWSDYRIEWKESQARFWVNAELILETKASPLGPLGLVLWVDNQYAALPPDGRLGYGTLANPTPVSLEIRDVCIE